MFLIFILLLLILLIFLWKFSSVKLNFFNNLFCLSAKFLSKHIFFNIFVILFSSIFLIIIPFLLDSIRPPLSLEIVIQPFAPASIGSLPKGSSHFDGAIAIDANLYNSKTFLLGSAPISLTIELFSIILLFSNPTDKNFHFLNLKSFFILSAALRNKSYPFVSFSFPVNNIIFFLFLILFIFLRLDKVYLNFFYCIYFLNRNKNNF